MQTRSRIPAADPGGPGGPGPLAPKISSKSCSFQAILREKPLFRAKFGLKAPLGVKTLLGSPDPNPGSALGFLQIPSHSQVPSSEALDVSPQILRNDAKIDTC